MGEGKTGEGMGRKLKDLLSKAYAKGGKEFDRSHNLEGRFGKNAHGVDRSQENVSRIRDTILSFIKRNIGDVNWRSQKSIDEFCGKINQEVARQEDKFKRAYGILAGNEEATKQWKSFVEWLKGLRNETKTQILAEVAQMREPDVEGAKPAEGTHDLETPADEDNTVISKDNGGANVAATSEAPQEAAIPPVETEEQRRQAALILENIETLARGAKIPDQLVGPLSDYTQMLQSGDVGRAVGYLGDILRIIRTLDVERRDAIELWEGAEESNHNLKGERMKRLQDEINTANEILSASDEEISQLRSLVDTRKWVIQKGEEEITQAKALIEELRRQLDGKDVAISDLVASLERNSVLPPPPEVIKEAKKPIDFSQQKEGITSRLAVLDSSIAQAEEESYRIASWLQASEEDKRRIFLNKRVVATAAEELAIEATEKRVDEKFASVRKEQANVEKILATLNEEKRALLQRLQALTIVETSAPVIEGDVALPAPATLPDIHNVIRDVEQALTVPAAVRALAKETAAAPNTKIEGLPFTLEFSEADRHEVRALEARLAAFMGQDPSEIERLIPLDPEEVEVVREKYYKPLISELKDGTYLNTLKKAIAFLGALRRGNDFAPRLSKVVGNMMAAAKLVKAFSAEASPVKLAFLKSVIIGSAHSELSLVHKKSVGSKYGQAYELTDIGEKAAQVWAADLIRTGEVTAEQFRIMHQRVQQLADQQSQESREKAKK